MKDISTKDLKNLINDKSKDFELIDVRTSEKIKELKISKLINYFLIHQQ